VGGGKIRPDRFLRFLRDTVPHEAEVLYIRLRDASSRTLSRHEYPHLVFSSSLEINGAKRFDYVILDEVLPYCDDAYSTLKRMRELCRDDGKLIISGVPKATIFNTLIRLIKKKRGGPRNWIPKELFENLLYLASFSPRPMIHGLIIADAVEIKKKREYSYSIIIPCFNEEENIGRCIERVPAFKRDYEIIVVNDGSTDHTAQAVRKIMGKNRRVRLIDYKPNRGKGYATIQGLNAAKKDVLMILDADMSVRPEDLTLFLEPFESQNAEFVNGTRMVYPLGDDAMRALHIFGNKIFSMIFSYVLNQNVTDTLCGTKCLFRKDYARIRMCDTAWPDFDLLFGAAEHNLKIVEMPIWYQNREYGKSKMRTLKHGWMLLKAAIRGFVRLRLTAF